MASVQADDKRQEAAKRYGAIRRKLYLLELLVGAVFGLWLLFGGIAAQTRLVLASFAGGQLIQVAAMMATLFVAYTVLLLPLSFYAGYHLPHRFGLSRQTRKAWMWDWLKAGAVSFILGLIVVEVVYFLLGAFPDWWWLYAAVATLLFTASIANLAPVLLVPLFYRLMPLTDHELARRLVALASQAGTRVHGAFVMDMSRKTTAANAALMGLGNTRRIVVGDTLLANYDGDEIETVLAHELGHHVHGDVGKGIALQSAFALVGFYLVDLVLSWGIGYFGYAGPSDVAAMPLLALVIGAFGVASMPLGNGYSRHIEAKADRYALRLTGKADAFARAMIKLGDQNLLELDPPRWVEVVLFDHPATARRVKTAREFVSN